MCLGNVLGKALASLHQCGVAEPELLLGGVGGVHARAVDVDRMLLAVLASAPSLNTMSPLATWLVANSPPDSRRHCSGDIHNPPPPLILFLGCPRQVNPLLVVDELVCKPSKELKAACSPVVPMDNLLEKKVGINADDAKDSKVEPLVPMFGGEIGVHPQLVGAHLFVPVDGAGALVVLPITFGWATSIMTLTGGARPDLSSWRRHLQEIFSPSPMPHVLVTKKQWFWSSQSTRYMGGLHQPRCP
jgi:hypothetical protein